MNGSDKRQLVCWDSCIFLAWFNKELDKPLPEIERSLRSVVDNKLDLLVSVISIVEVLDKAGVSDAGTQFRGFIRRPNVVLADVDPRVAMTASDIRTAGLAAHAEGRLPQAIKIPDAMIAATGVIYRASILYTFDPILTAISEWDVVNKLKIAPPGDELTPLGF
jgi:predicted nucleic acid-binding protein